MTNIQKHALDFPWDTASLHLDTRKFLKNLSNLSPLGSPLRDARIKIIGGYTADIIESWIKIFAAYYGVAVEIDGSDWGPAFTSEVSSRKMKDVQLVVCLNHSRDLIASGSSINNTIDLAVVSSRLQALADNVIDAGVPLFMTTFDQLQSNHPAETRDQTVNYKSAIINAELYRKQFETSLLAVFSSQQLSSRNNEPIHASSRDWYQFGLCYSVNGSILLAESIARHLVNQMGLYKKALVVDLDNTLWGGIIGDDGKDGIELGQDTTRGRIFSDIQHHLLQLKKRGVLLAIASKNEESIAKEGFDHPATILSWNDFAFRAVNWDNKSTNIERIASALNIGLDSIVFIDDNPMERAEVRSHLAMVTIPDCGENPEDHLSALLDLDFFHRTANLTNEDLMRNQSFSVNEARERLFAKSTNHEDFLRSINTKVLIKKPEKAEFERILQLTNKTNQFNLTTKRLTQAEFLQFQSDPIKDIFIAYVSDAFSEYGLTSVMYVEYHGTNVHIDNWLMSCRIFSKTVEHAMFKHIASQLLSQGLETFSTTFTLSDKNARFQTLWSDLGFKQKKMRTTQKSYEFQLNTNASKVVRELTHFCEVFNER